MKNFLLIIMSLLCFFNLEAQEKPKLIVGVVVDQMRVDYIYRYWDKFEENGFKRLVNEGFFCRNTHFNYIPTYTGPGHASIYTGTNPMTHGIIANDWYDRELNSKVYCVGDESVTGVGTDNESGKMSPKPLIAPTLGDAVRISNLFKGKSIGISIKDRGAILPAGHSANAAYWMDYESGKMVSSSYYMSDLPKWVKKFNSKNEADELAKEKWFPLLAIESYSESTKDLTPYETPLIKGQKPVFPYDVQRAIKEGDYYNFAYTPFANTLLRRFADECIINEDLGQDEYTDLLAISFSSTDLLGHAYGPHSLEIEDMYLRLDQELARLLDALDTRVGEGQYVFFLTADHGAAHVPKFLIDNKIPVGQFDKSRFVNELKASLLKEYGSENLIASYSNQQIFLNHSEMKASKLEFKRVTSSIREFALAFEGVANVLDTKEMQHPLPPDGFSKVAANGWNPQRSGDIAIQLLPGWMEHSGLGTTHGSSYSSDTHVPLLFFGFGVPHGESITEVDITQIAPTISFISRIEMPEASDHRPIEFK